MSMDMDMDDIDEPAKAPPAKPPRFAPKSSKFQPKSKQQQQPPPKSEPKLEPPPPAAAAQDGASPAMVAVKKENADDFHSAGAAGKMEVDDEERMTTKQEEEQLPASSLDDAMEEEHDDVEEEEEDIVVSEFDVYFTPSARDSQLYVFQYPLRPSWRPYELEERCTEVRVKPNSAEVEVDLSVELHSDNYNQEWPAAQKMTKQTVASKWRSPQATRYAVGMLMGRKVYLNPVRAVVQLRPSMDHLDFGGSKKKNVPDIAVKAEGSSREVFSGPSKKQNNQMDPEVAEPWIPLKYHSLTTDLSQKYQSKMMTEENNAIHFSMTPYDYLNSLCPGDTKMNSRGPSRRSLLLLPLEERLKKYLIEGPSIERYSVLKHLAPDNTDEEVLQVLQRYAVLVQGLWVPKTAIRHPKPGPQNLARDYALVLFSKNPFIKYSELDVLGSQKEIGKTVLREIAVERQKCEDWKFKVPTDQKFINDHPNIVNQQRQLWEDNEKKLCEKLGKRRGAKSSLKPDKMVNSGPSIHSNGAVNPTTNEAHAVRMSMPKETREALPKILRKLFQTHKVCSFQTICQGLRDMAVSLSTLPKADSRAAVAAAQSVEAPHQEELQAVITEVAVNVHGVYVLKSSLEHQELNPLRNVVIDLFLGSGPNAKLKKSEIIEAAKIKLQKEPTNNEFQKVITEFCVSKGGAWVMKSGDGVSK